MKIAGALLREAAAGEVGLEGICGRGGVAVVGAAALLSDMPSGGHTRMANTQRKVDKYLGT